MADERKVARRSDKSDVIDATAVARAAIREDDLPLAYLAGPEREIAWLVDHRAQLVAERTRVAGRLSPASGCCTTSTRLAAARARA